MALEIKFELDDDDLARFQALFEQARSRAAKHDPDDVLGMAEKLAQSGLANHPPSFVRQRLEGLQRLVAMARDDAWQLPHEDRQRVIDALAYFAAPDDVIDDSTPVIGLLDDAIAAELLLRALRHELDAYEEFSRYRVTELQRRKNAGKPTDISKEDWVADHRAALHSRAQERRLADPSGWHVSTLFGV